MSVGLVGVIDPTPHQQDNGVQQEGQEKGHQHSNDNVPIGIYTTLIIDGRTW